MVLVPGFSPAVPTPLFFIGSGRSDRRPVILFLGLTVLVSNVVVAVAPSFVLVLIARMLFGATLGAFWTVVALVGPKLVGPAGGTRAITIIAAGISGGTVVGLPAGQFLGNPRRDPYFIDQRADGVPHGGLHLLASAALAAVAGQRVTLARRQ